MKITSFNPFIVSSKSDDIIKFFEELGFERHHHNEELDMHWERLKDANGFYIDVVQNDVVPNDKTVIRMNVDNFDEAHDFLVSRGFKDGPKVFDAKSSKCIGMNSPSGFIIALIEHKKNHD